MCRTPRSAAASSPGAPRSKRAEPAGGREQARGLQLAAQQVALAPIDVVPVGVVALGQLARGPAPGTRRTAPHLVVRRRSRRAARTRARTAKSPVASRRLAAAASRTRSARPRRSGARVDDVVVDERRHVDQLDGGRGAHRARRPRSHPPQMNTSSGRRRLPPAASVSAAASAEQRAVAGGDLLEQALGAFHQRAGIRVARRAATDLVAPRSIRRRDGRHGAGVDRDDAAGEERVADVAQAGRVHQLRRARAPAGSAAPTPAGSV